MSSYQRQPNGILTVMVILLAIATHSMAKSGRSSSHYNSPPSYSFSFGGGSSAPKGPPPAYSVSNPVGGAHTNIHESPPAYSAAYKPVGPPAYSSVDKPDRIQSRPAEKARPSYSTYYNGGSRSSTGYHDPYNYTYKYSTNAATKAQYFSHGPFAHISTLLYLCWQLL
ncbi:uncharacterized protein LOC128262563 isoform X2 [Drosophila gunungcola]|uniref:uncharacterized protein LOC128262563 isoform X2 n=1 Tax=Drosophila gunungcola TaxID=103775 RepID=UPI0022E97EF4|nr:uncharacterized protein LOC128262563 isoform X2 [Drosophila gunungcola]